MSSGGLPYQVPSDNPFVGTPGARPEIFALGLRNPWRASFDSASGAFFIGDVGENTIEEVNLGQKGANYGWPIAEGPSSNTAFVNPIAFYGHSVGNSVTGGYVYSGESDGLNGQYFYAEFGSHRLFTLALRRHELDQHRSHQPGPDQHRHDQQSFLVRRGRAAAICTSSISTERCIGSRQPSPHPTSATR